MAYEPDPSQPKVNHRGGGFAGRLGRSWRFAVSRGGEFCLVLNWTKQHPPTVPAARFGAAMAYDAATGNVVLFSGSTLNANTAFGDTWVWGSS